MRTSTLLITAVGAALLLSSCDKKEPDYNTSHPDHGKITLTADWSNIGTDIVKPANYDISVAGYTCTLSGDNNTLDKLFDPGTYTGLAWNQAENMTVSGTTASVAAIITNDLHPNPLVNNMPEWLFTACNNSVVVEKDKHHQYTATMQQQVRELTLVIEPTGGTVDRIERIEGYLSGVAGTMNIDKGTHDTPSHVALTFVKGNDGKYSATVRLLGIAGEQQKLTATLSFTGGNPSNQTIESDLHTVLTDFNADKKTPLTLGAKAVETITEVGFEATITAWTNQTGGSGIAN